MSFKKTRLTVNTTQTVNVIRNVFDERVRQYQEKGRTRDLDDAYFEGTLAHAAAYLIMRQFPDHVGVGNPIDWPWPDNMPKPRECREDLVRAAAMLIAEIESLDRKEGRK